MEETKFNFFGDVDFGSTIGVDLGINLIKHKENEIELDLNQLLSKQCQVESNMRGITKAVLMLNEMSTVSNKLDTQIVQTAKLAESVSAKVRRLDMARSRVSECQQRVHDLIDLRLCSQGVTNAIASEDFEIGAVHINRFLSMDLQLLKKTADDVQGSVSSVSDAIRTLEKATIEMRNLLLHKFNEAVKNDDLASVERYFKIFPLLGCHAEGIERFSKYICVKLSIKSQKELCCTLDLARAQSRLPLAFADALTSLLENYARVIEVNQPIVESCYGTGHLIDMLKVLQIQCDKDVKNLLTEFNKNRKIEVRTQKVKEGCSRNFVTGSSNSAATLPQYRNSSGGSFDKLSPKDIDALIDELTIMHSRFELYFRFMKRRIMVST